MQTVSPPSASDKRCKPPRFHTPADFDAEALGLDSDEADPARYLLHLIRRKRVMWQADPDGYVRLKWAYLRRAMGHRRCTRVIERLRQEGGIEIDHRFAEGGTCKGYRIGPAWAERPWVEVTCSDDALARRVAAAYDEDAIPAQPVHRWLFERLDLIDFDLPRALAIVPTIPFAPAAAADGRPAMTEGEYRRLLRDQAEMVAARTLEPSVCRYGRAHSFLTSLPRQLRCCLSVGGEPLAELDVANSQPLFLGMLARDYHRSGKARQRLLNRAFDHQDPYRYGGNGATVGPCDNAGVERYVALCEAGRFYESLMDDPNDRGERERVKVGLYREAFFGPNRATAARPLKAKFTHAHPDVAAVLRELKRKNYRTSSWVLQNAEATLCIDAICGRLMRERPGLVLGTIHNSWLVPAADAEYVRSVVEGEFASRGVRPLVRIKHDGAK